METRKDTPWLKARLREMGRTPTSLARHLGVQPPAIYPVVYGSQAMPREWVVPTASFLGLPVQTLLDRLSDK
jgi:plasmid maintenance system antidote protein VapI